MLHKLWLHTIRCYLQLGLFFYYKRIRVVNKENVPKKGAVLLLSNHQNALIDALLIATKSGRFSYFLTRASVFSGSFTDKFLKSLQMLPVYRVRDGWKTISNNNLVFSKCAKLLYESKAVALFPEGNHSLQRTVRNLSKGFTRIVFKTLKLYPDTNLQIVPIGLNFQNAVAFGDSVSIYFGKPIDAKNYLLDDENAAIGVLKRDVQQQLSTLTTHIPSGSYDAVLNELTLNKVNFLHPENVNACISSNFKNCELQQTPRFVAIKKVFKFLMIITLFGPYLIWKFKVYPKIKEPEFVATFRFAIVITLVPIWLLLLGFTLAVTCGLYIAVLFVAVSLCLALLAVKL
ncbi:1-acyl-sn-glycerol-3-phosphate acyltransferase [Corallibacter sp.]|uniref:1-acyl-sn-glycerol-3-phosphate acyltransferase n=1 Tax=Corallibacter sp. TaxID=2038084 RepID=UPI003AB48013